MKHKKSHERFNQMKAFDYLMFNQMKAFLQSTFSPFCKDKL